MIKIIWPALSALTGTSALHLAIAVPVKLSIGPPLTGKAEKEV